MKFQASSLFLWLYGLVCVGPGRKPRRPVFSERGSNNRNQILGLFQEKTLGVLCRQTICVLFMSGWWCSIFFSSLSGSLLRKHNPVILGIRLLLNVVMQAFPVLWIVTFENYEMTWVVGLVINLIL